MITPVPPRHPFPTTPSCRSTSAASTASPRSDRHSPRISWPPRSAILPQWSDAAVAEAAGFRSIGDGVTGHEHFIQCQWIDDEVRLDPDAPESLVYEPQPDGTRRLVSAM